MKKRVVRDSLWQGLIVSLLLSNFISVFLFVLRVLATDSTQYWFLFWNLVLAWLPVVFAWLLRQRLRTQSWWKPEQVVLTVLWLGFLPNSFYLISDLIHLQSSLDIGVLYDSVFFMSCIWNGLVAGMLSIYWVHEASLKRLSRQAAHMLIALVIGATSFAIYLGRSLDWNSWDIIISPGALLFDVTERVINPLNYPQAIVTTTTFFLLLGSMYAVVWSFLQVVQFKSKQ